MKKDFCERFSALYLLFEKISGRFAEDRVTVYAAQAAFFGSISVFPLLLLLLNLLRYIVPIEAEGLAELLSDLLPAGFDESVQNVIAELLGAPRVPVISVTALTLLWSVSKGIRGIGRGIRNVMGTSDTAKTFGFLTDTLLSLLITVLFALIMLVLLLLLLFGGFISDKIALLSDADVLRILMGMRGLILLVALTIIFMAAYRWMAPAGRSFRSQFPGAIFAAAGWLLFSWAYSLYIKFFAPNSFIYGGMTAAVLLLLWFYMCMIILLSGAELNMLLTRLERGRGGRGTRLS